MDHLKLFQTHSEYAAFIQTSDFIKPNVSHCVQENEVHYNPYVPPFFCKLTLNDGSTIELEGSGELTSTMTSQYISTVINAEIGELCTSIGEHALGWYGGVLSSVTISDSVTSIGNGAFEGCSNLRNITIPNSVTSIGSSVFKGCSDLMDVTIGSGVTSIDHSSFYNCSNLETVTIPNSVISIEPYTFYGCSSLISVTIGSGVTSIGASAFQSCSSLTSITIPDSVTSIADRAFDGCSDLMDVTIGSGVTSIGDYAFQNCSLGSIYSYAKTAPTISANTFSIIVYEEEEKTLAVLDGSTGYNVWLTALGKNWGIEEIVEEEPVEEEEEE